MKACRSGESTIQFFCPGCQLPHEVSDAPGAWKFNGDYERPTFQPSVRVRSGHHLPGRKPGANCWCTYNALHPGEPSSFKCAICHSFVTDGRIQFLGDSTHALSGQTVELPDF